jgi:hypothetical protein
VRRVILALNKSKLRYALTGALASSYYGRPRTTLDVDVLIVARREELARLVESLTGANLKTEMKKLKSAWMSDYRIASIADSKSPHRLDIIFTDDRLERKTGSILGLRTYYQTAESLILAKLRMIKATLQPERTAIDKQDIRAIMQSANVSLRTLRRKANAQGTLELLDDLIHD